MGEGLLDAQEHGADEALFLVEELTRSERRLEERLRRRGPVVTSQEVGLEVLALLRKLDDVAYMRFASVYKDFQEITDFEREVGLLLLKRESGRTKVKP